MKKTIRILGVLLVSAFMLLPLKTSAAEPVWTQELDLNDSVSSAIAKVEDGVVVMQYEGTASASNLLIKYDFNGKKIWEIDNDYGYNIESVSDGFIVWSETKITKFDKDKNILWSKDVELQHVEGDREEANAGLGNKLIEVDNEYIIGYSTVVDSMQNDIFRFDLSGNIINRTSTKKLLEMNKLSTDGYRVLTMGSTASKDRFIVLYIYKYADINNISIREFSKDFKLINNIEYNFLEMDTNQWGVGGPYFSKIIKTADSYIAFGNISTFKFNENGKFKIYSKDILEIEQVDNYLYAYELKNSGMSNGKYVLQTNLVKYNENLVRQDSIELPLSIISGRNIYGFGSGNAKIQNRIVSVRENSSVNSIVLSTPIISYNRPYYSSVNHTTNYFSGGYYNIENNLYKLESYRISADIDDKSDNDSNNNISGIINNIIKNPQTNSIIIVASFVILILTISIISYIVYQRKTKNKS